MAYDVLFDNIAILSLPPQLSVAADITDAQFADLVGVPGFLANGGFRPNTATDKPINNLDFTWLNRFNITERLHLELSAEALNLFNHPQYIPGTEDQAQLPDNFDIYTPGVKSYGWEEEVAPPPGPDVQNRFL